MSGREIQRHGEAQLQGEMDEREFWALIMYSIQKIWGLALA